MNKMVTNWHDEEEGNDVWEWNVQPKDSGERIDKYLVLAGNWSRSLIQKWIKENRLQVNGAVVKANYKVAVNDQIVLLIPPPEELELVATPMDLDIYYEDQDLLVVNKPRGMVVHPAPGHFEDTLVNGLLAHCTDLSGINGMMRPGIVHRIDKDTSGLLVVAKNDLAHESLAKQLSDHTVIRRYWALVHGVIPHERGTIDAPIGRDPSDRQRMAVVEKNGKEAITHFQVMERFQDYTLVECRLETGRTHQIRVHMRFIGFPLVGDPKYGPKKTLDIAGQALHAKVLGFTHPRTGESLLFEAPLPQEMARLIEELRRMEKLR